MTVHVALGTAVAGSGLVAQNTGENAPWLPPSPSIFVVHRYYNRRLPGMVDDLLAFNPRDEMDVARARGSLTLFGATGIGGQTPVSVGRAQAKLLPESALIAAGATPASGANLTWVRPSSDNTTLGNYYGGVTLPITGVYPADESTLLFPANPRSTDLVTANVSGFFMVLTSAWQQQLTIQYTAASTTAGTLVTTLQYWDFTQNLLASWTCSLALAVGDFPAGQGQPICLSWDSTNALILVTNAAPTATTVAAGSNGVNVSTFAGAGTLTVASTTGFASKGLFSVPTSTGTAYVSYTGTSGGTQFTGCQVSQAGGAANGTLSTGGAVTAALKQVAATTTNSPVASRLLPWTGSLYIPYTQAGGNVADWGVDIGFPQIGRFSNAANLFGPDANVAAGSGLAPGARWRFGTKPKITVNASSTTTAWPKHLGGLAMGIPTSQNLTALQNAGCPLLRIGSVDDQQSTAVVQGALPYATITTLASLTSSTATQRAIGGGGTVGGTAIGINWANFDSLVLAAFNAGIDIHGGIYSVPTALQGAEGRNGVPASNANYALWASAIAGRYLWLQGQAVANPGVTATGKLADLSFFNEPDQGSGAWNDATDQAAVTFGGNGTIGAAGAVTGLVINGSQAPLNGMGVLVAGSMASGIPVISAVSGAGPYSFTLTPAPATGSGIYMRGLPANFAATYLACYQQIVSDQSANGNASPPLLNGQDGPAHPNGATIGVTAASNGYTGTQPFENPWWEACAYTAKANTLTVGAYCFHDYEEDTATTRGGITVLNSLATNVGFPSVVPRVPEWGLSNPSVQPDNRNVLNNWEQRWENIYAAAFVHSYLADLLARGVDMGAYFARWGTTSIGNSFPGALFDWLGDSAHISGQNLGTGKPTTTFYALALFWKHHYQNGFLTSPLISPVTTSRPNLHSVCSVGTNAAGKTVVTLSYSSFRPGGGAPKPRCRFDIDWTAGAGLPASYTWKQWHVDETAQRISRVPLIAEDLSSTAMSTLPYDDEIDWLGVGCVQIIGS